VLQRLRQSTESAVDKEVDNWKKAKEIVQRVHNELNAQKLSVMKLLADLDPLKIKKVSFHNFLKTLSRHLQSIPMEELKKMHDVVAVDSHGMALVDELARLILENRGPTGDLSSRASADAASSRRNINQRATEGLPPAESRPGIKARREGEELRFRKQADGLSKGLQAAEDAKLCLNREVNKLEHALEEKNALIEELRAKLVEDEEKRDWKKLRERLQSTESLRSELFTAQNELAEYKRRYEVDSRAILDQGKVRIAQLVDDNQRLEGKVKSLQFDLKRARQVRLGDDWGQKEEEYMRLTLENERLEEDVKEKTKALKSAQEKLFTEEHKTMELMFEKANVDAKMSRLENRILELQTVKEVPKQTQDEGKKSRKEKNLEAVIEGMERVIEGLRKDNERVLLENKTLKEDRRGTQEIKLMRIKIQELQKELEERDATAHDAARCMQESQRTLEQVQVDRQATRREKEILEMEIRNLQGKVNFDLEHELARLKSAREQDLIALDEAHQVLTEVEKTETRCAKLIEENRKLKTDLAAVQDENFWGELENLRMKNDVSASLFAEVRRALREYKQMSPQDFVLYEHLMPAIDALLAP